MNGSILRKKRACSGDPIRQAGSVHRHVGVLYGLSATDRQSTNDPGWPGANHKMTRIALLFSSLLLLAMALTSCAHAPLNRMLTEEEASRQFGIAQRPAQPTDDGVMVVLFFSGGGTRAAAFSYGVLKELSQTAVPGSQPPRRLLDDVRSVAAVSGGSFTAAYYCLYHDRIFRDFESRFLKKDIQAALVMRMLMTWPKLLSPYYGRSDMAAEYYDEHLFGGAKFGDLAKAGGRPFLAINATDLATGEHFVFTNSRFSLIASNRDDFPIARAVAASSAVPFILTPVTIKNYAGMPAPPTAFVPRASGDESNISHRESQILSALHSYGDSKSRPYIHLVDGGFADNLGLQSIVDDTVAVGVDFETNGMERRAAAETARHNRSELGCPPRR